MLLQTKAQSLLVLYSDKKLVAICENAGLNTCFSSFNIAKFLNQFRILNSSDEK